MDMFINRYGSYVLDDTEIDLVCDAIEGLIYKDLFEQDIAMVAINSFGEDNYGRFSYDRVIQCWNKRDEYLKYCCETIAIQDHYMDFCKQFNDEDIVCCVDNCQIVNEDFLLITTTFRSSRGDLVVYSSIKDTSMVEDLYTCHFGLVLLLAIMLEGDNESLCEAFVSRLLENKECIIDTVMRDAAFRRISELLTGDSKSAINWRKN